MTVKCQMRRRIQHSYSRKFQSWLNYISVLSGVSCHLYRLKDSGVTPLEWTMKSVIWSMSGLLSLFSRHALIITAGPGDTSQFISFKICYPCKCNTMVASKDNFYSTTLKRNSQMQCNVYYQLSKL